MTLSNLVGSLAAVSSGCGDAAEPEVVTDARPPPSSTPVANDGGARECEVTQEGLPRPCSCGPSSGTQVCLNGKYQACRCDVFDAGAAAGTLCKAGYYSGEFSGNYKPGAFGFGLIMSFFEVDIAGAPASGYPALSLTLEETREGSGEFQTFGVENGCMIGSAMAGPTNNPFVARINGTLNCGTGAFDGTITGNYNLVESGLVFQFTGPLTAQFRQPQAELSDGVWNVQEPPALLGEPAGGGGGTWSATWQSANPPSTAGDPCAVLDAMDAGVATQGDASP